MTGPPLEVADIIRSLAATGTSAAGLVTSTAQDRVLRALLACRSASLGGHVDQCDRCSHRLISYNSCRNRHCPKCQALARAKWFEDRRRDLLPTRYFHVVFTLPAEVARIALANKRVVYDILFRAASETLLQIAADPKHLGAKIGFLAVLHTWGQTLMHHPHLHCVVPGGGLSPDGRRWIPTRSNFLLPVKILSKVFRGKFLDYLDRAYRDGQLRLTASLEELGRPGRFQALLAEVRRKPWVVYAKAPMAGPEQVLGYLARYTHRVAIANSRLVQLKDGQVRFIYKDYAKAGKRRIMSLQATEFLRRFLLHVLPPRFVRIRHYGLLANRCRRDNVVRCRELAGDSNIAQRRDPHESMADTDTRACWPRCSQCEVGTMVTIDRFTPAMAFTATATAYMDSS